MSTTRQHPGLRVRSFIPYHRECKGSSFDWDGYEVITKDNPIVVLVPAEPREIDSILDNGVLIWIQ
jgi:hypothetical protein